ncbi:hypothetical protein BTVI_137515 [Pitangus sulphuratus]|nr:hypothetical protein BTVI_137515 [Pitangus sulphuratus]
MGVEMVTLQKMRYEIPGILLLALMVSITVLDLWKHKVRSGYYVSGKSINGYMNKYKFTKLVHMGYISLPDFERF